jgi:hypothetical protein
MLIEERAFHGFIVCTFAQLFLSGSESDSHQNAQALGCRPKDFAPLKTGKAQTSLRAQKRLEHLTESAQSASGEKRTDKRFLPCWRFFFAKKAKVRSQTMK